MNKLTAKQERFVAEYLIDLNATQAAIRAGYSEKGAFVRGSELLRNRKVAEAVAAGQDKIAAKLDFKAEDVLRELGKIGFANIEDYITVNEYGHPAVDLSEMTREQAAALSEVSYDAAGNPKIKLADKRAALVDLGRHFELFTDKAVVDVNHGLQDPEEIIARAKQAAERLGITLPLHLLGRVEKAK